MTRGESRASASRLGPGALPVVDVDVIEPEVVGEVGSFLFAAGAFLLTLAVVLGIGWYLLQPVADSVVRRRNPNNPTLHDAIARYIRTGVVVLGVLAGIYASGYGHVLEGSAIVIAAAALTLGVAGREVIGSIVSGLALVLDPEFNVGDYIEWEGGEGTVRSITLRVTRVSAPNGELVTVPNTVLTGGRITRPFGQGLLRVIEPIEVAGEDLEEAIRRSEEVASAVEDVLDEPNPRVVVDGFGEDGVRIHVHYWIRDPRRRDLIRIRSSFARRLLRAFEIEDIEINPPSKRDLEGRIDVVNRRS